MNQAISPVMLTIKQAVASYGIPKTKLYNEIRAGKIDARKAGKRTLLTHESLRSYVEALPALHASR